MSTTCCYQIIGTSILGNYYETACGNTSDEDVATHWKYCPFCGNSIIYSMSEADFMPERPLSNGKVKDTLTGEVNEPCSESIHDLPKI